MITKKQTSTSS
jgi:serine/threonine protein kinase